MTRPSWLIALMLICLPASGRATEPDGRGQGIKVAVLDSGFRGYRDHLGKELPPQVVTQSFREDGNLEAKDSVHGLLCAEVIHTLAPGAELLFANWEPDEPESFLKAVRWCREQGATVFSCSIVMPGWSDGRGGGDVHRRLRDCLGGALFFASAGNLANRHWTGPFRGDDSRLHVWEGNATANGLRPWGAQPVSVELVSYTKATYKLRLIDSRGGTPAEESPLPGGSGTCVRFRPMPGHEYGVSVEQVEGTPGDFRLIALGADLEFSTATGCMVFPGDGAGVIAVGAVDAEGKRQASSSTGSVDGAVKPDLVASVPFCCKICATPFAGTSAAAPQAAAIAARVRSGAPHLESSQVREILLNRCEDLGPPGPDAETGHGRLR